MITEEMIASLKIAIDSLWGKNKDTDVKNLEELLKILEK